MDYAFKVTTHGREVLAACLATGAPLRITKAEIGSGTVPEGVDLAGVHTLYQYVTEGTIAERRHEGDRLYLTVQYDNAKYPEQPAFFLSEFMVYVEDPETGEDTDFIYATLGDYRQPVPAYSPELPESIFSHPMVIVVSNEIKVEITASPGLVTHVDLSAALAAHNADPAAHEGILERISNPSLLDNGYFIGGGSQQGGGQFPINPRGQTEYTIPSGDGYTIDRWVLTRGTMTLEEDGIGLRWIGGTSSANGIFHQRYPMNLIEPERSYTFSILTNDNELFYLTAKAPSRSSLTSSYQDIAVGDKTGKLYLHIMGTSDILDCDIRITTTEKIIIKAAKLELGPVQTLAHKEGDTWVLNDPPPNYALELAKCQRYQTELTQKNAVKVLGNGVGITSNTVRIFIPLPTSMRGVPTISWGKELEVKIDGSNVNGILVTDVKITAYSQNAIAINAIVADNQIQIGRYYTLYFPVAAEKPMFLLDFNL